MLRRTIFLAALGLAVVLAVGSAQAEDARSPVLVELFTSQGCSSCPPADELIGELARRDDVVALSLHVSYWDYIGWKDAFAIPAATARQKAYDRRLARGRVYTPQMVIDGVLDEVGSNKAAVRRAIALAQAQSGQKLDIDVELDQDRNLLVSIPGAHFDGAASIWLARYDAVRVTNVARGENAGRTVRNYNVVRELRRIGTWTGLPLDIRLPATALTSGDGGRDGCVIIIQKQGLGPVLAVRRLMLTDGDS
ncbi:MAG: DUF1223 domain-containing protein [Alphaproteobacteria bacterium]